MIRQRRRLISKSRKTASDKRRYAYIEKLDEKIHQGGAYTIVNLAGEFTGAPKIKLPCQFMYLNARKKFKSGIGFGFPVVVYTYETPGRGTNWVVIFKVPQSIHTDNLDVI